MNINLQEEETNSYVSLFQSYLENIQSLNIIVSNVLNDVMEQSKYEKLQRTISSIMDTYTETVVNNVATGVFFKWQQSDASLRACLRMYQAGSSADRIGAQVEQKLGDLMAGILRIKKADVLFTDRPIVNEDDFERLENICRSAQTEIQNIKSTFLSQLNTKAGENDLYASLEPLAEWIATRIEEFFGETLDRFNQLHYFVRTISQMMRSIAEENGATASSGGSSGSANGLTAAAQNSSRKPNKQYFEKFKQVTKTVYDIICHEKDNRNKTVGYEVIAQISGIYFKFYHDFGNILKDEFQTAEARRGGRREVYKVVTESEDYNKFFNHEEDAQTFRNNVYSKFSVFETVAQMTNNIASACIRGEANDTNLINGVRVLFTPVINGHIDEEDRNKCDSFCKTASEEILRILGIGNSSSQADSDDIDFSGDNFSEETMKLVVKILEQILGQSGIEEINSLTDNYYDSLVESRNGYSQTASGSQGTAQNHTQNDFGRYTVTNQSIQKMVPLYGQAKSILDNIDVFYQDKFEKLGSNFDKVNEAIHSVSSFIGMWGIGAWNLSEMFSSLESAEAVVENVKQAGLALSTCSTAGKIIAGGMCMVKILDWTMPYIKKSKTLVKLNEKFWNLTRQDIQIPYYQRMMDQYVMEHYEIKYGVKNGQSGMFGYYHNVVGQLVDESQRRSFENAIFAAESQITPQNYTVNANTSQDERAICLGLFLNLARSGLCCETELESGAANDMLDKLYGIYMIQEGITPRVDIDPTKRIVP